MPSECRDGLIFLKPIIFSHLPLVKKIFPVIILLISISLAGIIIIQINWLKNMLELREDQLNEKISEVVKSITSDLSQYISSPETFDRPFGDQRDGYYDLLTPSLIGSRFTSQELYNKFRLAFDSKKLDEVDFQYALLSFKSGDLAYKIERQSPLFLDWYNDSSSHKVFAYPIIPASGSSAESLTSYEQLIIVVPDIGDIVFRNTKPRMIMAILFTLVIMTAFYLTVYTMLRQKKLTEIKNDFINNMTHEFKTPIATISLAVDALRNEKVQRDPQKMGYFSGIIKEENQRMNRQVETILKSALLDRQEVQLNIKPLHVHQIIEDVVDNFMLRIQDKQGSLQMELGADADLIEGDEVHISNLVTNLMDNAVKYSKENVPPEIVLRTSSNEKKFILRIEDNGIGMTRETVKRIFEKFYRAHTGNVHNVKGFGLGLSYVKSVVDAHHGQIRVDSTVGRGSCFTLEFPLAKQK